VIKLASAESRGTLIDVKNSIKQCGAYVSADNISCTIEKGEMVGFFGPNGAGKTTAMNVLT